MTSCKYLEHFQSTGKLFHDIVYAIYLHNSTIFFNVSCKNEWSVIKILVNFPTFILFNYRCKCSAYE